ncbi:hypothetical protein D307_gp108 [Bacillus phage Bastille]|uniref:Uncharacterized protein n=5 Tax=Bastillevirus TaxID=1918010 RepID=A0A024B1T1_9CAUD|nr:hypothetical protein D307_gp108 [Bacillus phage Bastille]YP_009035415.1 hypothetical protein FP73_gp123 [Bacillus phage Hoody T]YP_009035750.1 hypothetical protein FP76_gp141 [Bacillus phage Evoli]AMW61983.1 hypothetical protein DNAM5_239 [Bacillus phage Vinny]ASR79637.1 hypothetical protein OTK52_231 [Bacillus phage OTooleKemple52]ASR79711.1 hypothetical protein JANET_231 [Bacillus phage Janet]ASU01079.1 hypothetical protein ANTHONY_239 [Bacillus phage Anthony]AXQ67128.1 hypothetical pro
MSWFTDSLAQYERQMQKVNHLVLHDINQKRNVDISMEELEQILKILHDYGIVN